MKKWLPILVLGLTQFVMVLDGTVMNVSITEVVGDLGTTCLLYTSPSPRDGLLSRMPSSA